MFDWFGKVFSRREYPSWNDVPPPSDMEKVNNDMSKVIPFPYIVPPESETPAKVFYRLGVTDKNSVSFSMGMMEITMTKAGVQNLIEQLQVFRDQLQEETDKE